MTRRLYQPATGFEGFDFMYRWCDQCQHDAAYRDDDGDSCPIAAATMALRATQPGYPREWTYAVDGTPCCTAFVPVEDVGRIPDLRQMRLPLTVEATA